MPQDEGQGGPGPLGAAATAPVGLRSPPHLLPAPFPPVPLDTQNRWQRPGCWKPPSPTPPRTCSNALSPAPGEGVLGRHGEAGTEALQGLTRGPLPPRGAQTWMGPLVGSGAPVGARRVSGCGCLPPDPPESPCGLSPETPAAGQGSGRGLSTRRSDCAPRVVECPRRSSRTLGAPPHTHTHCPGAAALRRPLWARRECLLGRQAAFPAFCPTMLTGCLWLVWFPGPDVSAVDAESEAR